MSVLLVCPKSSGNTFKVCSYVVNNSDVKLSIINKNEVNDLKKYESIILCSGVYGDNVHKDLLRWIEDTEKKSINENTKVYVFLTWFGRGKSDRNAIKEVKSILEKKKINIEDDYITCFGSGMGIIRHGHPDKKDCEKILNWVKAKN